MIDHLLQLLICERFMTDVRYREGHLRVVNALPEMYGKNLTFKTGGVDGCDCEEILRLIEEGKIDTTPLITHRYKLADIEAAYHLFENKLDRVIKIAVEP